MSSYWGYVFFGYSIFWKFLAAWATSIKGMESRRVGCTPCQRSHGNFSTVLHSTIRVDRRSLSWGWESTDQKLSLGAMLLSLVSWGILFYSYSICWLFAKWPTGSLVEVTWMGSAWLWKLREQAGVFHNFRTVRQILLQNTYIYKNWRLLYWIFRTQELIISHACVWVSGLLVNLSHSGRRHVAERQILTKKEIKKIKKRVVIQWWIWDRWVVGKSRRSSLQIWCRIWGLVVILVREMPIFSFPWTSYIPESKRFFYINYDQKECCQYWYDMLLWWGQDAVTWDTFCAHVTTKFMCKDSVHQVRDKLRVPRQKTSATACHN